MGTSYRTGQHDNIHLMAIFAGHTG